MVVALPQGALFRKSAERTIRRALLENDMIGAVIGLAPNLFYGTQLAGCVVVLQRKKPIDHMNKFLIIDASSLFRKGRAQNFLDQEHSDLLVAWYGAFEDALRRLGLDTDPGARKPQDQQIVLLTRDVVHLQDGSSAR